jgi:hypothetical protein
MLKVNVIDLVRLYLLRTGRIVVTEYGIWEGDLDEGTRHINYQKFIDKHLSKEKDAYSLGYLTHLLSDHVWMEHIYYRHGFKQRLDLDPNLLQR